MLAAALVATTLLAPTHYDLTISIDYAAEVLHGKARIEVRNPSAEPVREAPFILYRTLKVTKAGTFRQNIVTFDDDPKLQVNYVVVTLPEPLAPQAKTAVDIEYEGPLLGYTETGMLYVKDKIDPEFTIIRLDAFAYPVARIPSRATNRRVPFPDFTYTARIDVPKDLVVANGGHLDGVAVANDRATYTFTSLRPSFRMDFAIAKYGELSAGPIRIYYLPGDKAGAESVAEGSRKSMDLFTRWFGPLPVPASASLTFIEIPDGCGSQADVTTIIEQANAFKNPKHLHEVYHEISHLWNLPDADQPSPRWNEGLASFLEDLADEEITGQPRVDKGTTWSLDRLRTELPKHPEWKTTPFKDYGRAGWTDLSYNVGDVFFDLLYRLAGRETFSKIIAEQVASGSGRIDDLMSIVRKRGGTAVGPLVDDFVYTTKWTEHVAQAKDINELLAQYRR